MCEAQYYWQAGSIMKKERVIKNNTRERQQWVSNEIRLTIDKEYMMVNSTTSSTYSQILCIDSVVHFIVSKWGAYVVRTTLRDWIVPTILRDCVTPTTLRAGRQRHNCLIHLISSGKKPRHIHGRKSSEI